MREARKNGFFQPSRAAAKPITHRKTQDDPHNMRRLCRPLAHDAPRCVRCKCAIVTPLTKKRQKHCRNSFRSRCARPNLTPYRGRRDLNRSVVQRTRPRRTDAVDEPVVRRRPRSSAPAWAREPHAPRQEARGRARVALHHDALAHGDGQLPLSIIFVDEAAGLDEERLLLVKSEGAERVAPRQNTQDGAVLAKHHGIISKTRLGDCPWDSNKVLSVLASVEKSPRASASPAPIKPPHHIANEVLLQNPTSAVVRPSDSSISGPFTTYSEDVIHFSR